MEMLSAVIVSVYIDYAMFKSKRQWRKRKNRATKNEITHQRQQQNLKIMTFGTMPSHHTAHQFARDIFDRQTVTKRLQQHTHTHTVPRTQQQSANE